MRKYIHGMYAAVGAVAALACLGVGGVATATAAPNLNADIGYPIFNGTRDPMPATGIVYNPSSSYLAQIFAQDQAQGAGNDTAHDFYVDRILARYGTAPNGKSSNHAGSYNYEGADGNRYLFTRGRAAYMYDHAPNRLGFVGAMAYWDTTAKDGFSIDVSVDGKTVSLKEDSTARKQTPSYFTTVFTNDDGSLRITETKYITYNNVAVANITVQSTSQQTVTLTASSPFATTANSDGTELTGRVNAPNNLTTLYPRFSGNGFTVKDGALQSTLQLAANAPQTTKVQLGLITDELPDSTTEYEARYRGDLADPAKSYQDAVTTYNAWWAENIPYIETPEHNIDKTVLYRWWLARFNMLDANMPGNTFQFPTSIEGVLGYNNQIVLTSGMFINDTKWLRSPEYSYGTWISAGQTAKQGKSGYYYYHDNPGDPANWNHSYTQYITKAGWDSYKVHGGPSSLATLLGEQGSQDVKGLLASKSEPDANDNQNNDGDHLIDWSWNSMTGNDADAVSFSQHPGERMNRADGSANLWANAMAAAQAYRAAGMDNDADAMQKTADNIKQDLLNKLWDNENKLIRHQFIGRHNGELAKYKEINNYYPYSVGLMPTQGSVDYTENYDEALRLFADSQEFPIFPFFTANQADKAALNFPGSNNFSIINATPLLQIYSAGIRDYHADDNGYISAEQFKKLLYWVAFAHYQGGDNRYPDQNEFWNMDNNAAGSTIPEKNADASKNGGKVTYRSWIHHTQLGTTNWTMIEDVAGMVPRQDSVIELNPIAIPGWDHFTVNNLRYHGMDVSIVWNNDGTYQAPKGYTLYINGQVAFTADKLAHIKYDSSTGTATVADQSGATIINSQAISMPAANEVTYTAKDRVTDLFAKAGHNIDTASQSQTNVLKGASVSATFEADGHSAKRAVDGTTVMESFWGTKGSKNAKDSITIELNEPSTIDDIRLYFYQTSSSQTVPGYAEPSVYSLEYQDANGTFKPVAGLAKQSASTAANESDDGFKSFEQQVRTPARPTANYNHVQFAPVATQRIRVTVVPQAGRAVGVKEVEAYNTGIVAEQQPTNQAPNVDAYVASSTSSGAELVGITKDDGMPNGLLTTRWSQVSGPEGGKVNFADETAASTVATFNIEGDYELKLTASDGQLEAERIIQVHGIPSDGTVNIAAQATAKASSRNQYAIGDVAILNDGVVDLEGTSPMKSWNNWGQGDKEPWVQYVWNGKVPLGKVQAYFWSDGGGVPMPKSWKVQTRSDDGTWQDVTLKANQQYKVVKGEATTASFETVWTDAMRIVFTPQSGSAAVGLSELEAYAVEPNSVEEVQRVVKTGSSASDVELPQTVSASYPDGSRADLAVSWKPIADESLAQDNAVIVPATVTGALDGTKATLFVRSDADALSLNSILPQEQSVLQGSESIALPKTVTVRYMNGALSSGIPVIWNEQQRQAIDLSKVGDYEVTGSIADSELLAHITVHVIANGASDHGQTDPEPEPDPTPDPKPADGWIESTASSVSASAEASWSPAADKLNDGVVVDTTWPDADDADVNAHVWGSWGVATDGMYAQYDFPSEVTVDQSRAQFWANFAGGPNTRGGLEIPNEWSIQYLDADGTYKPVVPTESGNYVTTRNDPSKRGEGEGGGWSTVQFTPVTTKSLRLVLTPYPSADGVTYGAAVAEWGVHAAQNSTDPEPNPDPDPEPEPDPDPEPDKVDKSALSGALQAVQSLEQERFTPKSWQILTKSQSHAQQILDDKSATQSDVDSAVSQLEAAQKALVQRADAASLRAVLDKARALDSAAYTKGSWQKLAQLVEQANSMITDVNAEQSDLDAMHDQLLDVMDALELVQKDPTPEPGDHTDSDNSQGSENSSEDNSGDESTENNQQDSGVKTSESEQNNYELSNTGVSVIALVLSVLVAVAFAVCLRIIRGKE